MNKLEKVHTHLFAADVAKLKQVAFTTGSKWQVELRQLVRRALKGESREIVMLKERP